MCGLAGIFTSRPRETGDLAASASAMADRLVHRGPDDSGVWSDEARGVALGFRRLSIVDLSDRGHQPMRSHSGRYVLVFNGEIYNDGALRSELEARGARFRGRSDTEVVLAAFDAWGVRGALDRFIGMFAMAVWDEAEASLTLLRDRLGIKPLFYYAEEGLVTFGSELKALAAGPSFQRTVDPEALRAYLRYLYVPAPRTIFRNAYKIPPGHFLTLRTPRGPLPEPEPYWGLDGAVEAGRRDPFTGSDEEAVEELDRLLRDAVALRMRSDVPLGAFLSGGIDSSAVVALMQDASHRPVRTFSIGFGEKEHDESVHAAAVASKLGTEHRGLRVSGEEAGRVIPLLPEMFDEPHADPSQIPTYLVSRLAREDVTVAMSGDGGDELFGGYNRYVHGVGTLRRLMQIPSPARKALALGIGSLGPGLVRSGASILPASLRPRLADQKMAKMAQLLRHSAPGPMYRSLLSAWQDPGELVIGGADLPPEPVPPFDGTAEEDMLRAMMRFDQGAYLADDLLAKVDRASMARSLEVRVPILDHRVVELSWRLPPRTKLRDRQGKWILREVLHRYVPPALVDRPKVGFSVPVDAWLRGPLREWAEDLLAPEAVRAGGLLEPEPIWKAWEQLLQGRVDVAPALWAVLTFQAWEQAASTSGTRRRMVSLGTSPGATVRAGGEGP